MVRYQVLIISMYLITYQLQNHDQNQLHTLHLLECSLHLSSSTETKIHDPCEKWSQVAIINERMNTTKLKGNKKMQHTELFTCLWIPEKAYVAPLAAVITWFSIGIAPNKIGELIENLHINSFHISTKQVDDCIVTIMKFNAN